MKTKELKLKNKGITLIALVVTVVVTIIIAMISIAALTGDNSTIENANKAKEDTEIGEEKEILTVSAVQAIGKDALGNITEENLEEELTNNIGERDEAYKLTGTGPFVVTYLDSERSYIIDENGNVSEYVETDGDVDISEYVQVGQYVNYNPTVKDLSGTPVDESLTYISQKGDGQNHGNGDSPQTFTATATGTRWKVLSIENGTVTLISEDVIKTDAGGNFVLRGAPGYLYAEQELNEVCKIYGYGYGANKSQVTTYSYGGPTDGELTGQITGSGARSITVEDINKYAGITEDENGIPRFSDGTAVDSIYGSTTMPTTNVYYPTITTEDGKSTPAGVSNLKYTYYNYNKSKVNQEIQNILWTGNNYWLASRCVNTISSTAYFYVRSVYSSDVGGSNLCYGISWLLDEYAFSIYAVRPLVSLKSEVIDIDAGYNEANGGWKLK